MAPKHECPVARMPEEAKLTTVKGMHTGHAQTPTLTLKVETLTLDIL